MLYPDDERFALTRQLLTLAKLDPADRSALMALPMRARQTGMRGFVVRQETQMPNICVVTRGVVCGCRWVRSGQRQIISIHFAGGLLNLPSLQFESTDIEMVALSRAQVAFFPVEALQRLSDARSGIRNALARQAFVDQFIIAEWLAGVGRRDALERVSHFLCETYLRNKAIALAKDLNFELAMTQSDLGDATGLSAVHINRTMRELRERKLIAQEGDVFTILEWDAICEVSGFDPRYLHLLVAQPASSQ